MVFRAGGVPHNRLDTPEKISRSFYAKVQRGADDDCWRWVGEYVRDDNGYGRMVICGKRMMAHRVSFELHFGKLEPRMQVCHKCDNPWCVNPSHLFQGSPRDNRKDCTGKMRHAFGSKSPNAILTESDVREIKAAYKAGSLNQRQTAKKYGVSWGLIGHIVHGRAWTHV